MYVLQYSQAWENARELKGAANPQPEYPVWGGVGDGGAVEAHFPSVDLLVARNHIEQRRLAGAIWADQSGDLALLRRQRACVERLDAAVRLRHAARFK